MHTLINGSQKNIPSNSKYFLNYISKNIGECSIFDLKADRYDDIIKCINMSDNVVLALPLYADSPNTIVLSFFDYIMDNNICINKNFYIIINCGFLEGKQNISSLNIIKNWCKKVKANYSGSVLIGAGEVAGNNKYKIISKKVYKSLDILNNHIKNNTTSEDIVTTISLLNNKMYCFVANISWYFNARKNKLTRKDIKEL